MGLFSRLIQKPVTISMIILAVLLLGGISYYQMKIEYMPESSSEWLSITVRYPNMSPETIEEMINKPIEEKMGEIGGIKNIFSTASEGEGKVNIEFLPEINIKRALIYVRQKMEMLRNHFPKEANEPEISRYNPLESPIYIMTLKGGDLDSLRAFSENYIKPKLERIEGVSNISIGGGRQREIEVKIDLPKLKAYEISINNLIQAFQSSHVSFPLGKIKEGTKEINVSLSGRLIQASEISNLSIPNNQGKIFLFGNFARVIDGKKEKDSIAREDNSEIISIYIQKSSGANTIDIIEQVEKTMNGLKLPDYIQKNISFNQAEHIKTALKKVRMEGFWGMLMAMGVIFLFIGRLKETLMIGLSLPLCIAMTLGMMFFAQIHLNMMTLSAMVLGIGLLADNSIVIVESIEQKNGKVLEGLKAVLLPVGSSSLAFVLVFVPFILVNREIETAGV